MYYSVHACVYKTYSVCTVWVWQVVYVTHLYSCLHVHHMYVCVYKFTKRRKLGDLWCRELMCWQRTVGRRSEKEWIRLCTSECQQYWYSALVVPFWVRPQQLQWQQWLRWHKPDLFFLLFLVSLLSLFLVSLLSLFLVLVSCLSSIPC